jgi:AcrR family transcriptional regulator
MPKGFTEQERKIIGGRLLEQGHRLFSTYGLKKTSVEELAAAAGISKGAFYLFYETKEALFMDVMEQAEGRYRQQILALVGQPGPTPRARLFSIFKTAFELFNTEPILQAITRGDYEMLALRVTTVDFDQHLSSDYRFVEELVARCREAGIPITAPVEQITGLMYSVVFARIAEGGLGPAAPAGTLDVLLELVAAYCLGEVVLSSNLDAGSNTG